MAHAIEGGKCNGEGNHPPGTEWKASEAKVCTSAARKTGDTPCARQERRSSGGLVSLLRAERMHCFQGRRCGQEQARCGGWRRTRTCGRSQGGRPSSLRKTIYGRLASGITGWAGNMIHARWMNELELGRLVPNAAESHARTQEKTRTGLDLQSGRMDGWRKRRPTRPLETEPDFENGMEARRELQERFRVYFPALPRSMAVTGCFWSAAGRATKAHGLPQQSNHPLPSLGKFLLLFLLGGLEGRSALQLRASGSSLRPSNGRSVLLFLRSTEITGITSCFFLLSLETLVHLASLLRRTGKCSKTYREVRFFVPGSASGRTGKCAIAYREVRFEKSDTQPACGRLYREVR